MFGLQSLLHIKNGNPVPGAMSPVELAKEMAKQLGFRFSALLRVNFHDGKIHQCYEDGGLTGHDTLIIVTRTSEYNQLIMFADEGVCGVPVAL